MKRAHTPLASPRLALDFQSRAERFDPDWYGSAYPDLDPNNAGDYLVHFIDTGSREGRAPNLDFAAGWYLGRYPRVRAAIEAGTVVSAFHDFLQRREQGLPRRGFPALANVGADLSHAPSWLTALLIRMTERAPGWDFHLLAPPGYLPVQQTGPNAHFYQSVSDLPPIDLWLELSTKNMEPEAVESIDFQSLSDQCSTTAAAPSATDLDRMLERLRGHLFQKHPIVPANRIESGPVHIDPDRVTGLGLTVRTVASVAPDGGAQSGGNRNGGVVLREGDSILAELPPTAGRPGEAVVYPSGKKRLWLTISPGLVVELRPVGGTSNKLDLVVVRTSTNSLKHWKQTLDAVMATGLADRTLVVDAPTSLNLPSGVTRCGSLTDALSLRNRPVVVLPVGARPFPQIATQVLGALAARKRSCSIPTALRHPDGHLATWPSPTVIDGSADPGFFRRWSRFDMTVLCARDRKKAAVDGAMPRSKTVDHDALGAVGADVFSAPLRRRTDLAPEWLHIDARPDGGVIGKLRLRGRRFEPGGQLRIEGHTKGTLAAPCKVAVWPGVDSRNHGQNAPLTVLTLPQSGQFVWPINLPLGTTAPEALTIRPVGEWPTVQNTEEPRPLLFRLEAVRYRPSATRPRAMSRSRYRAPAASGENSSDAKR